MSEETTQVRPYAEVSEYREALEFGVGISN